MKKIFALFLVLLAYASAAIAAVNINTANVEQLQSLPGIGPVKAQAIVQYRAKNGLFKTLEDLKKVDGIGDKTFEGLKNQVTLTGTTKTEKVEEKKHEGKKTEESAAKSSREKEPSSRTKRKKEVTQEKPVKDKKPADSPKDSKKETKEVKTGQDDKTKDAAKK